MTRIDAFGVSSKEDVVRGLIGLFSILCLCVIIAHFRAFFGLVDKINAVNLSSCFAQIIDWYSFGAAINIKIELAVLFRSIVNVLLIVITIVALDECNESKCSIGLALKRKAYFYKAPMLFYNSIIEFNRKRE